MGPGFHRPGTAVTAQPTGLITVITTVICNVRAGCSCELQSMGLGETKGGKRGEGKRAQQRHLIRTKHAGNTAV